MEDIDSLVGKFPTRWRNYQMQNDKVIVLSGYARGGTNIAWNLLQSHPQICSPVYETGELIHQSLPFRISLFLSKYFGFTRKIFINELNKFVLKTLDHPDNKYKTEEVIYTEKELSNSAICLKSVNTDIFYTNSLYYVYPNLYFIGLARNPYALADGYLRRGGTISEVADLYNRIFRQMEKFSNFVPNFKLIRFEDIIEKPFDMAEELFRFLDVHPHQLDKLRLKSKKLVNLEGKHKITFGNENQKYWFDRSSISQIIDPNINKVQKSRITDKMIHELNQEITPAMEFFGYSKY
jgi:hypothetical protein